MSTHAQMKKNIWVSTIPKKSYRLARLETVPYKIISSISQIQWIVVMAPSPTVASRHDDRDVP